MYNFLFIYLVGAGRGAAYFLRLRLQRAKTTRLLTAPAPALEKLYIFFSSVFFQVLEFIMQTCLLYSYVIGLPLLGLI